MNEKPSDEARLVVAWGIAICLILLGIGGCCALGGSFHMTFKDSDERPANPTTEATVREEQR